MGRFSRWPMFQARRRTSVEADDNDETYNEDSNENNNENNDNNSCNTVIAIIHSKLYRYHHE